MDRKPGHLTKDITNVVNSLMWVKLVSVGDAATGKTSLIKHFCESKFVSGYQPTVGVDYGFKIQKVDDIEVRVHLWDLSGNTEYLDVRNELYGTTDAVFLMYDVTSQSSFDSLDTWLREISSYCNSHPEIFLVANKVDAPKHSRLISTVDGKKWASKYRLRYYETSAATGEGVEKMLTELISAVLSKRKQPIRTQTKDIKFTAFMPTAYRSKSAKH